jgi:2-iminobutanoate/2-iminopropanoate deaminase
MFLLLSIYSRIIQRIKCKLPFYLFPKTLFQPLFSYYQWTTFMKKNLINPWQWQDQLGYAQAIEIKNNQGTLYCAGQAAMDATGKPVAGSMPEQLQLCLSNLEQVIRQANYHPSNVVRLNVYTTSIPQFFQAYATLTNWMAQHQIVPASTLLEVKALAFPELQVEIEATVVG